MMLLTKDHRSKLPKLRAQENKDDPKVYIKFFHPLSSWYWFITEGEPVIHEGKEVDFQFFGFVKGDFPEWGYISLKELEEVRIMGMGIERDKFFAPKPFSEVSEEYKCYG